MTISKMSLKIESNGWKGIVKWCGLAILAILFLVFFIRVAIWENAYYREKEGSERNVVVTETEETAATPEPAEELIEEEPTEQEIYEYVVAADKPRYLTIEALGISNARILALGVDDSGALATPRNIFDVGWYEGSGKPGQGGTLVIDGHNGGPHVYGVFKRLPDLVDGDIITVERGDGARFNYSVVENKEVPLAESDKYMSVAIKSPIKGKESVTLISCTGEWSQQQRTYLSRQFTRAILVN